MTNLQRNQHLDKIAQTREDLAALTVNREKAILAANHAKTKHQKKVHRLAAIHITKMMQKASQELHKLYGGV